MVKKLVVCHDLVNDPLLDTEKQSGWYSECDVLKPESVLQGQLMTTNAFTIVSPHLQVPHWAPLGPTAPPPV